MESIFVLKEQLQQIYAKHSKIIGKLVQWVLAFVVFFTINKSIGVVEVLKSPMITMVLSVICALLPPIMTVYAAALLMIGHLFFLSLGMAAVTLAVYIILFAFYIRYSPKTAIVILLMPVAFLLKVPYVIPVAFGLVGTPVYIFPILFGTIIYYMIDYVKEVAPTLSGADKASFIEQGITFIKQVFQNKELWFMGVSFFACILVVFAVKKMAVDHSWKIASVAGAVTNIVILAAGSFVFDISISFLPVVVGNVAAVLVGIVLELLFFAVDYSRCEQLQFEDDEYFYYVKAVPKIVVSAPEKTVKRINKREESKETEIIDPEKLRNKNAKQAKVSNPIKKVKKTVAKRKEKDTDHLLLTQSLRKELDLDK